MCFQQQASIASWSPHHGSSNQHDCHRAQHECGRVHDGLVHLPARYSFWSSFHGPALRSLWSRACPARLEYLVLDLEHRVWFREDEGHSHHSETFRWVRRALAGGVLGDVWRPEQRGKSLGMYLLIPLLGAAVGMSRLI